jgi:hypothetical protein
MNDIMLNLCFGVWKKMKNIRHCKKCKDGRLINLRSRELMFCGFCGSEFRKK